MPHYSKEILIIIIEIDIPWTHKSVQFTYFSITNSHTAKLYIHRPIVTTVPLSFVG